MNQGPAVRLHSALPRHTCPPLTALSACQIWGCLYSSASYIVDSNELGSQDHNDLLFFIGPWCSEMLFDPFLLNELQVLVLCDACLKMSVQLVVIIAFEVHDHIWDLICS